MKKQRLIDRLLRAIMRSRFEPIETVLAFSAILHGIWLVIPYWAIRGAVEITPAPRAAEMVVGLMLFTMGAAHLSSIKWRLKKLRKNVAFVKFIAWFFLTILAYMAAGPDSIIWIAYLTVSLTSAIVYLNIGVRDDVW